MSTATSGLLDDPSDSWAAPLPLPVPLRIHYLHPRGAEATHDVPPPTAEVVQLDLSCAPGADILINPQRGRAVPTGIAVQIPADYEGQIRLRPELSRAGMALFNAPAIVHSDYHSEITLFLLNLRQDTVTVRPGDPLAQLVIAPLVATPPLLATRALPRVDSSPHCHATTEDAEAAMVELIDRLTRDPEAAPRITIETRIAAPLLAHRLLDPRGDLPDAAIVRLLSAPPLAKLVHVLARVPALAAATFELFVEHALAAPDLATRQAAVLAADLRDDPGHLPAMLRGFAAIEPALDVADWARSLAQRLEHKASGDVEIVTLRAREVALQASATGGVA